MLDDNARHFRSLQAYAVNAPVPTPKGLHQTEVPYRFRLGQSPNILIYFLLLHQKTKLGT